MSERVETNRPYPSMPIGSGGRRRRFGSAQAIAAFDARVRGGEDVSELAREFGVEPWYAARRAARALARPTRMAEVPPPLPSLEHDEDLTPLERAERILGRRAVQQPKGWWTLDGKPCGPLEVVREANKMLVAQGVPPIHYPLIAPIYG